MMLTYEDFVSHLKILMSRFISVCVFLCDSSHMFISIIVFAVLLNCLCFNALYYALIDILYKILSIIAIF